MCGIVGVSINKDKKAQPLRQGMALFKSLLVENTKRGKDATGIVYQTKHGAEIYRGFLPGAEAQNYVLPSRDVIGLLGHTRYATVGNKGKYENVHPFETEKYVGVHNGTIFNHKLLKAHFGLKTNGDCDSEVLYRLLDKVGIEGLKFVEGLYMLAYIHKDRPEEINLLTNGSKPLVLLKLHGELTAFGSLAEDTQEKAEEFWKKFKKAHDFEKIKPCTLYRLKNGKIIERRDLSSRIKFMSEAEGELRYKVDYKILKRDLYQMTVPLNRRLAAGSYMVTNNTRRGTVTHIPGTNNKPSLFDSAREKCELTGASDEQKAWAREAITHMFKMLESRMISPAQGTKKVMFNIDTLGMAMHFYGHQTKTGFIEREIPKDNNRTLQLPEESMVMLSGFPSDNCKTRLWLPNAVQSTLLFNSLLYTESLCLYTKDSWQTKMPTASQLLTACVCNIANKKQAGLIHKQIKTEFVDRGLLDDKIMVLSDDKTKDEFLNFAKREDTRVFSKRNHIVTPFLTTKYRSRKWFSAHQALTQEQEVFGVSKWKVEDVALTGLVFFLSELLTRFCEKISMHTRSRDRIYKEHANVYNNPLNDLAVKMYKAFKEGDLEYLAMISKAFMEYKHPDTKYNFKTGYDMFEAALREQVKCAFGNGFFSSMPNYTDIFTLLNKNNDGTLIHSTTKHFIKRISLLNEFVTTGEVPDISDTKYRTITLKSH